MKNLKTRIVMFSSVFILGMAVLSCSKNDDLTKAAGSERISLNENYTSMIDSVFVNDSAGTRTFTIIDNCGTNIGTITTNANNQIRYQSQTSSTISIIGNGSAVTLDKNVRYFFLPSSCTTGPRFLRVTFANGTQSLCTTFFINGCTWTHVGGGCTIINAYAFVSSGPPIC